MTEKELNAIKERTAKAEGLLKILQHLKTTQINLGKAQQIKIDFLGSIYFNETSQREGFCTLFGLSFDEIRDIRTLIMQHVSKAVQVTEKKLSEL